MPLGIGLILRVAVCAKMIMATATIQVTSMELVIPNPLPNSTKVCGFNETPSCSAGAAWAAEADGARIALVASGQTDNNKYRLRILVRRQGHRHPPRDLPRSEIEPRILTRIPKLNLSY